jgi:hypothetical protein
LNITTVGGQELYKILFGKEVGRKVNDDFLIEWKKEHPPAITPDGRERYDSIIPMTDENSTLIEPDITSVESLFRTGDEGYYEFMRSNVNFFKTDDDFDNYFSATKSRIDAAFSEGKLNISEYKELLTSFEDFKNIIKGIHNS